MKIFILLLFCFPLFGQANILEWEQDGLTYQDATLDNKLVVSGKINHLRCVNCSFELVSNGSYITELGKTIDSDKVLLFSKDSKPEWYTLLGQKIDRPTEPGMYILKRGDLSIINRVNYVGHEIYIDSWGSFGPINGGL